MSNQWSKYQKAIFNFVETGEGNAIVEAVAGSGKSTTIVECLKRLPAGNSSIFLAFNKSIAEELKSRGVNARTFHSLTYGPVMRLKGSNTIEGNKLRNLVHKNMSREGEDLYGKFICRLVGLARQSGIGCLIADNEKVWEAIAEHHDLELEDPKAEWKEAIRLARMLLTWSNESNLVDFDDLLYLAVKENLALGKFDYVFVDESQDTNAIQRALLRKILKPTSRIIAVGDPSQAIYGFRGADSDSMSLIGKEFNCISLPLTVSYRCATSIVKHAKQWVDHIEAAPNAKPGSVLTFNQTYSLKDFQANDLIVCRSTKPLISLAYQLIREHVPATIMGREIGSGLKTTINKMNAGDIDMLLVKLEDWRNREVAKAIGKGLDGKAQSIDDKYESICCLIEGLSETERTIPALLHVIDNLFNDKENVVKLATIHKAKGLEADTVYWLNYSTCPSKWARQAWQKQQEINLCYVATTRAKNKLILINERGVN